MGRIKGAPHRYFKSLPARFWKRVRRDHPDECWVWNGGTNSRGFGHLSRGGRDWSRVLAHRLAWELDARGPARKGMAVRHVCGVKVCVNPGHLVLADSHNVVDRPLPLHPHARRWTRDDVRAVRTEVAAGRTVEEVAAARDMPIEYARGIARGARTPSGAA